MVAKNKMKVNVVGCPIHREPNHLAMSSRNVLLSPKERQEASIIYKSLIESKKKFKQFSAKVVTKEVEKVFKNNTTFTLEYYLIADEKTLIPCKRKIKNKKYRAFIAVFVRDIRLIDTISLN
jgi:pantoate--beta-alanine ligase